VAGLTFNQDGSAMRRSPIQVLTGPDVE